MMPVSDRWMISTLNGFSSYINQVDIRHLTGPTTLVGDALRVPIYAAAYKPQYFAELKLTKRGRVTALLAQNQTGYIMLPCAARGHTSYDFGHHRRFASSPGPGKNF